MRRLAVVAVMVAWGVGCSSGGSGSGGGALTCEWLAGDNCWKQTATAATACLPPTDEHGTLSDDGRTCTYASGAVITFASPLVFPLPDEPTWNFTVSNAGQTCLHYEDVNSHLRLVVGDQTVTEAPTRRPRPCRHLSGRNDLFQFERVRSVQLRPGRRAAGSAASWSDSSVSFGIIGTSSADAGTESLAVFDCRR